MQRAPVLLATHHVDDQNVILSALETFALGQHTVVAVDSGGAAAFLQDTQQRPPALILLDEELPDAGGLEVLELVRADPRLRRIPVVMMARPTGERDIQRIYDAGANSCLRKPASRAQFQEALCQVIRYWMCLNQPA